MKIAFLHLTLGLVDRGSEISTRLIARGLAKQHRVLMIQGGPASRQPYQTLRPIIITQIPQFAPQNPWQKLSFRLSQDPFSRLVKRFTNQALAYLREFNPDVIIPVNGHPQIKILKTALPGKPMVVFGRAGIGYHDRNSLLQNPALFVALSPQAATWAKHVAIHSTKVVYLPNPFDSSMFAKAKPAKVKLPSPLVLTVSALSKYKNIDLVIRAIAQTKASLLIVGQGEEEAKLKRLAAKLLPQRHQFLSVNYSDLPPYYRAADAFCLLPDPQEAFGRVYLEAMAAHLPIVAPKDPIRRQIIGPKGYFALRTPNSASQAIKRAIGQKPINYQFQLTKFTPDQIVAKLNTQLKSLIDSS